MTESCISADAGRSLALGLLDMEQANRGLMVKRIKKKTADSYLLEYGHRDTPRAEDDKCCSWTLEMAGEAKTPPY